MSKHTPGPWTYRNIKGDDACIIEYGDYAIAKTFSCVNHQIDSHEANARLIAAAPETAAERNELKEAKRELVEALERLMRLFLDTADCSYEHYDQVIKARAALAKHSKGE